MKKDMTTFEMAQAAYENPGKVFVSGSQSVVWDGEELIHNQPPDGDGNPFVVNLYFWARRGYIWNEKVEPRKWSGEYKVFQDRSEAKLGLVETGEFPVSHKPISVKEYRVKWEAEEVL